MAIITVTTLSDGNPAGKLTLRQAIAQASDGDTIVFKASLGGSSIGVVLKGNLEINKSVTIDGSQGGHTTLGSGLYLINSGGSVIVGAGADVTLAHLNVINGVNGANGRKPGRDGRPGDDGTTDGPHGTDGSDGGNGTKAGGAGFAGSPALINQGNLTLDHVTVSGSSHGGSGRKGGDGGHGGDAGDGTLDPGNGGNGGNGGRGSNGATAVGGILNEGGLILRDSAVQSCSATGGGGGDGGAGGTGGAGGDGNKGGTGGAGGNAGNGGSGGAGIGGILNNGSVTIEGAALFYGNTGTGGAGGDGGTNGVGGLAGHLGSGASNDQPGMNGSSGAMGSTGSGVAYDGAGPTGGSFASGAFFELTGPAVAAATISAAAAGGTSFRNVYQIALREGQINATDTVNWHVAGGGLTAADFVGGVMPGGTLTFAPGMNSGFFDLAFASTFTFTGTLKFRVVLDGASANTAVGSHAVYTQTLYAATAGADTLAGTAGFDSLSGGDGNDLLTGGAGGDLLVGDLGRDTLKGGADDDELVGAAGADVLTGGSGSDRFSFYGGNSAVGSADRITDFDHGEDDLINFGFQAHDFIGHSGFSGTAGEIRYTTNPGSGTTRVYFDTDGDAVGETVVVLDGLHHLFAADFGL